MNDAIHTFRKSLDAEGFTAFNYNEYRKMFDFPQCIPTYDEICCIFIYLYDMRSKIENAKEV